MTAVPTGFYGHDDPETEQWADQDGTVHGAGSSPGTAREPEPIPAPPITRGQLVTLATVAPERVTWLWEGRLPVGKLVVLDGDPSLGKSTLALTFAAHVSTGKPWPDGAPCTAGDVVIMSAEDGLADTVRPRLDAAGGDPARVHALTEVRYATEEGELATRPPTLADVEILRDLITRVRARLLVVDVLMAYLPRSDSHRDQDMRAVLHPVAALAEETGCTVLLLRHLNKTPGGSAMYRGGGSIGIVGAARAAFLVAPDPDDETGETRVLASIKSNLAVTPAAMTYRLESAPDSHVARVVWLGESEHRADSLLSAPSDAEERTERDEAVEWLTAYLTDKGGAAPAAEVMKAARADGIAERTLKRARQRAGVTSIRSGFPARAMWSYDPVGPQSGQPGQLSEPGTTGTTVAQLTRRDHEESEEISSQKPGSSVPSVDSSQAKPSDQDNVIPEGSPDISTASRMKGCESVIQRLTEAGLDPDRAKFLVAKKYSRQRKAYDPSQIYSEIWKAEQKS